jgi:signal peptidase II
MNLYQSIPIIQDFFYLTYVTNDGMAFGLSLPGGQITLTVLSVFMTLVLVYFFWLERNSHLIMKLSLSLIISGALGNLVDRILAGKVVDFLHIKIGSYWEWYIFNIADTSVSIGMVLFIIHSFYIQDNTSEKAII